MNKNILIVALTNLERSPRPLKQIECLRENFHIDTIGLNKSNRERNFYKIKKESLFRKFFSLPLLLFRMYDLYYWDKNKIKISNKLKNKKKYDLIIVHEVRMLPLVFSFSGNAKVILDAHEYSPNNFDDNLIWRIFIKHFYIHLCKKYLKKCNYIFTVGNEISKLYLKNFGIKSEVITNAADFFDLTPSKIDSNKIKILHHGNASSSRKLELMIEMMKYVDSNFELYLMLVAKRTNKLYLNKLKKIAKKYKNIHFLKPVPYNQLIEYSNSFDIGLLFFPPSNLNLKYCLPNKFFEYIQSRLCIVSGPSIEIKNYIDKYDLGITSTSFNPKEIAKKINLLSEKDILIYKNNSDYNAKLLSSSVNKEKILHAVKNIIKS